MGFFESIAGAMGLGPKEPNIRAHNMVRDGAILLDVRSPGEFAGGHLKAALNIPVQQLGSRLGELKKKKSKSVVVYCRSGARSSNAKRLLQQHGYDVYDIGPMGNWGVQEDIVR